MTHGKEQKKEVKRELKMQREKTYSEEAIGGERRMKRSRKRKGRLKAEEGKKGRDEQSGERGRGREKVKRG